MAFRRCKTLKGYIHPTWGCICAASAFNSSGQILIRSPGCSQQHCHETWHEQTRFVLIHYGFFIKQCLHWGFRSRSCLLGASCVSPGCFLGASWVFLGPSWVPLGASWLLLGCSWMPLGCLLGAPRYLPSILRGYSVPLG